MNIRTIVSVAVVVWGTTIAGWAKKAPEPVCLKAKPTTLVDVKEILTAMDISMYSFDLSQTAQTPYKINIYVESHRGDSVQTLYTIPVTRNIRYVDDFSPEHRDQVRAQSGLKKNEQVVSRIEELKFYLLPKNDSVVKLRVHMPDYGTMTRELKLDAVVAPSYRTFFYVDRPFKLGPLRVGEKTPLLLYGSGWFDPKANIACMCGEREIDPDLSKNEILGKLPHYYVVGIRFDPTDQ